MGKSLIIKGADFSANCIVTGLPTTFDYEIIGVSYGIMDLPPSKKVGDLFIYDRTQATIGKINSAMEYQYYADLIDGQIFKLTDDVFASYNNGAMTYMLNAIIYPSTPEQPAFQFGGYIYDQSTGTITLNTAQTSYRCVAVNVKKGDVIVMNGSGAETIRPLVVKTTGGIIESVSQSYTTYNMERVYIVENDGTAYYSTNINQTPTPKFDIFRLGDV